MENLENYRKVQEPVGNSKIYYLDDEMSSVIAKKTLLICTVILIINIIW